MSRRSLGLSNALLKSLADLPSKHFKQVVSRVLGLVNDPQPPDSKKLQGYENLMRVDSGEYRIIYSFTEEVVDIVLIGKRNDDEVYRQLERKFQK